jgi:hypothetical protein
MGQGMVLRLKSKVKLINNLGTLERGRRGRGTYGMKGLGERGREFWRGLGNSFEGRREKVLKEKRSGKHS